MFDAGFPSKPAVDLASTPRWPRRPDAVHCQAAVDGQLIELWHLAAMLDGLRLRMEGALTIIDRGAIIEAARHALALRPVDRNRIVTLGRGRLFTPEPKRLRARLPDRDILASGRSRPSGQGPLQLRAPD